MYFLFVYKSKSKVLFPPLKCMQQKSCTVHIIFYYWKCKFISILCLRDIPAFMTRKNCLLQIMVSVHKFKFNFLLLPHNHMPQKCCINWALMLDFNSRRKCSFINYFDRRANCLFDFKTNFFLSGLSITSVNQHLYC